MGLEIVELIMAVEERFDIEIPDEDAEKLETVGAIHAYVWGKVATRQFSPCPSQAAFHWLRRGLVETQDVPRKDVRPVAPLASLLPVLGRRARWEDLGRSLDGRLPELEWPTAVPRLIFGGACFLLTTSGLGFLTGHPPWGAVGLTGTALFAWLTPKMAASLAVEFPTSCATVGAAAKALAGPRPDGKRWVEPDVWEALKVVVLDHLDVPLRAVTPDAHLVYDLGAG